MVLYEVFKERVIDIAWNRDLILEQKRQLIEQYERTEDQNLKYYITFLDAVLDFENNQHFYQSPSFKIKRQNNNKILYLFEDFLPDIESSCEQSKLYTYILAQSLSVKTISEEAVLTFNHDFFKILDKELYEIFLEVYKHRHDNFQILNKRSATYTIAGIDYSYVNVEETNAIDEYFSSTHEYGHAIQDKIYFRPYEISNYPFHELLAFFSEYLSILYYERLHPEDLEDVKRNKHILLFTILNYVKRIMYYYNYSINYNNHTKLGMILNIKRINRISLQETKKIIAGSLYERFIYSIAFLTLIELLYTEDLEKSIYIVKNLIKLPEKHDYISALFANGIILTEHLSDFIKYTEKNHDSRMLHI